MNQIENFIDPMCREELPDFIELIKSDVSIFKGERSKIKRKQLLKLDDKKPTEKDQEKTEIISKEDEDIDEMTLIKIEFDPTIRQMNILQFIHSSLSQDKLLTQQEIMCAFIPKLKIYRPGMFWDAFRSRPAIWEELIIREGGYVKLNYSAL